MLPITLQEVSFKFGIWEIPYSCVTGAGIGTTRHPHYTDRTLFVACLPVPGATPPNPPLVEFLINRDGSHDRLVNDLQARVADRWKGEAGYFAMRKRLGFSNRGIFIAGTVGVIVIFIGVILALMLSSKPAPRPLPRGGVPTSPARR